MKIRRIRDTKWLFLLFRKDFIGHSEHSAAFGRN